MNQNLPPNLRPVNGRMLDKLTELAPQRRVLGVLDEVYANSYGICVITGPRGSGRRRLLNAFANRLRPDTSAAIVEGSETSARNLLSSILAQFGYDFSSTVLNEMAGMLRVFAMHQTQAGCRPFVGVLATEQLNEKIRSALVTLAGIESGQQAALSFAFCGTGAPEELLSHPDFAPIAGRVIRYCEMSPLSGADLRTYLAEKYGATIGDEALVEKFLRATEGLPGKIDALMHNLSGSGKALSENSLRAALSRPGDGVTAARTHLLISQSGRLLGEHPVRDDRVLIGRAAHNDLVLESRYISRHHAFLIRGEDGSDWLVDLNSRNGTFVNSQAVDYWPLRDNDVIAMGNHRLKYINPAATGPRPAKAEFAESATAVMQHIEAPDEQLGLVKTKKTDAG